MLTKCGHIPINLIQESRPYSRNTLGFRSLHSDDSVYAESRTIQLRCKRISCSCRARCRTYRAAVDMEISFVTRITDGYIRTSFGSRTGLRFFGSRTSSPSCLPPAAGWIGLGWSILSLTSFAFLNLFQNISFRSLQARKSFCSTIGSLPFLALFAYSFFLLFGFVRETHDAQQPSDAYRQIMSKMTFNRHFSWGHLLIRF